MSETNSSSASLPATVPATDTPPSVLKPSPLTFDPKFDYSKRIVPDVPHPASGFLDSAQLWGEDRKPVIPVLRDWLFREGRLSHTNLVELIEKATVIFCEEPNLLQVKSPITSTWNSLYLSQLGIQSNISLSNLSLPSFQSSRLDDSLWWCTRPVLRPTEAVWGRRKSRWDQLSISWWLCG